MKTMRKTLSLILALVLAFSLAAVPAFAADTEADGSASDMAYGQMHNGLLSEILSQIGIANDDNFIHGIVGVHIKDLVDHIGSDSNFVHGIVRVTVGDLFKNIASNSNYTHGIVTVVDNRININFGLAFTDAQKQDASGETARAFLTDLLTDAGMTKIQTGSIVNAIAAGTLSDDQASAMVDQLAGTGKVSLTDITTLLGGLTDSGLLDIDTAAQLFRDAAITVAAALGIQPLQGKGNVSVLSHILDSIHIVDGDNFIHGIVSVNINDLVDHIVSNSNFVHGIVGVKTGDLFDNIASGCNYTHGIVTISGNVININFGAAITDAKADDLDGTDARTILTNICTAAGIPADQTDVIVSGIAQQSLSADDARTLTTQLAKTGAFDLAGIASLICALDSDQTISDGTAAELLESATAALSVDKDAADSVTTSLTDNDTVLSHILDQLRIVNGDNFIHGIVGVDINDLVDHIASDSNFIHGIVNVDVGDLFKDIASNNNYMHGIVTITGNTVNINFGQVIGDIAAGGANSEAAQQALAEILKAFGMTQTGINAILTGIAGSILTNDQIAQLLSQLISSANMNLKNVVTIICALYNSRTITLQQAMTLLEKYISQMGGGQGNSGSNQSGSGSNQGSSGNNQGGSTGGSSGEETKPAQQTGLLDTTNHKPYVSGRGAGQFAPNGTLTRAEAAQMLYALMTEQAHQQYDTGSSSFSDVPAGRWYTKAVSTLANVGAITGYDDGTFQPNRAITRAEFVTILSGVCSTSKTTTSLPFNDVGDGWYHGFVAKAYANGWTAGYSDGGFHPNQVITRAEAVTMLNHVLGRSCDLTFVQANASNCVHFSDVSTGAWYYAGVMEAAVGHAYTELAGIERWTALN